MLKKEALGYAALKYTHRKAIRETVATHSNPLSQVECQALINTIDALEAELAAAREHLAERDERIEAMEMQYRGVLQDNSAARALAESRGRIIDQQNAERLKINEENQRNYNALRDREKAAIAAALAKAVETCVDGAVVAYKRGYKEHGDACHSCASRIRTLITTYQSAARGGASTSTEKSQCEPGSLAEGSART